MANLRPNRKEKLNVWSTETLVYNNVEEGGAKLKGVEQILVLIKGEEE